MEKNLTKKCKKLYRKFELEGRIVILCIVSYKNHVRIGHSICNPEDKFDEELGKKIAYNRATHQNYDKSMSCFSLFEKIHCYGVFKSILEVLEEEIRLNAEKLLPVLKKKKK